MSIIIHFNPAPFIQSGGGVSPSPACLKTTPTKLEMLPGINQDTDGPVMTEDDSSAVDLATSNTLYKHTLKEVKITHHVSHGQGSCSGLPYQDHNYGAPPPPTPPSYSPCASPAHTNGVPDEDTNLSVVSTSTNNEETHEGSVTRCVCGFEHDDEYMICCDRCLVWQHVDCMGLDRNNIPDTYMCEKCEPRKVDKQKAKVLQARKKVAMTDTSESDEDNTNRSSERRPKTRSKSSRRNKEEEKCEEKAETLSKRCRTITKNAKERMEIKRSKLRRNKNKESTSTADEEAQDAWEYSIEWCEKHFEAAINNQYTPEIQHFALTFPNQGHEKKILEELQVQLCHTAETDGSRKRLLSVCDIPRDQPIIEFKGKFLFTSQFHEIHPLFNKRLYPFVLFHTLVQEEICIDASFYGNDARFIRRSCKPNSEICHLTLDGNLHLYISSTKDISQDEELTIPFDFNQKDSIKDIECACAMDDCILRPNKKNGSGEVCSEKRKKRQQFTSSSADDDSNPSLASVANSPVKSKASPVKNSYSYQSSPFPTSLDENIDVKGTSDIETEDQANKRRRKMTREERKIDAIMRAFDQMEKAAKRRQQALERLAQQKAQQPKLEDGPEKPEIATAPTKEEEKPAVVSAWEAPCMEEEKIIISTPKPKKGKRRRGSGTPVRRHTRTNSGGSDILSPDDTVPSTSSPLTSPESNLLILPPTTSTVVQAPSQSAPPPPPPPLPPIVLKTKRFLLHEWLQEKSESTSTAQSPRSIHTEVSWNISNTAPTCYVRCTKDNPNAGGISAAHLRRSSTSGQLKPVSGQGSAKKRWLRQAMYDCNTCEELSIVDPTTMEAIPSPIHNCCLSPTSHGEIFSPGTSTDDIITPLKKRRLMRESIESLPSPKSPSSNLTTVQFMTMASSVTSHQGSTDFSFDVQPFETEDSKQLETESEKISCSSVKEDMTSQVNGLRCEFKKIFKESSTNKDIDMELSCNPVCAVSSCSKCLADDFLEFQMPVACEGQEYKNDSDVESFKIVKCLNLSCKENTVSEKSINMHPPVEGFCTESADLKNIIDAADCISSNLCGLSSINVHDKEAEEDGTVTVPVTKQEYCDEQFSDTKQAEEPSSTTDFVSSSVNSTPVVHSQNNPISIVPSNEITRGNSKSSGSRVGHVTSSKVTILPQEDMVLETSHNYITSTISESTRENLTGLTSDSSSISSVSSTSISHASLAELQVTTNVLSSNTNVVVTTVAFNQAACSTPSSSIISSSSFPVCSQSIGDVSSDCNVSSAGGILKEPADTELQAVCTSTSNSCASAATTVCISATQKRKVSLSEYRMRMREGVGKTCFNTETKKISSGLTISSTVLDTLPEPVSLAPLPLFESGATSQNSVQHCNQVQHCIKNSKKKSKNEEEIPHNDAVEYQRENLTERLKREFGLDDDCEASSTISFELSLPKSKSTVVSASPSIAPILSLCTPPPPPPPRFPRPSKQTLGITATSPTQYNFAIAPLYSRPPFIVAQVPGSPYIAAQSQIAGTSVLSGLHQITAPTAQHSMCPLIPPTHSFTPSQSTTVLRPTQCEYASVNAQNIATLVQQPPPPPPPPPPHKGYPVYQHGLFK